MKEYGIYIRQGEGVPYMLHIFNDIDLAKIKLYDMISLEQTRNRPYFVDNSFYNNSYNISAKLKYFCIMERNVTDWKKYSEEKIEEEDNCSNIIFLDNFKKMLTK